MEIYKFILILTILVSILSFNNSDRIGKLLFIPYVVKRKNEWYRFITSGFVHADYMHLIFNMLSFYFFAPYIEGAFNSTQFLVLYLGSMIIADIPTYFKYQDSQGYGSLGASGAVSAIVFSYIMLRPFDTLLVFFIPMPAILYGVLFLGYSYYLDKKGHGVINHSAHFYGAVTGIIFTFVIHPQSLTNFIQQLASVLGV